MPNMNNPRDLFVHELGDVLTAERTIESMLPKLREEASDPDLRKGFEKHLKETRKHVENLEKVFDELGEPAEPQPCPGIEGLKKEHDAFVSEGPSQEVLNLFLTGAAARTEHYEIASYQSLLTMARALGERGAVKLLDQNLKQEKEMLREAEALARRLSKEKAKAAA